MKYKIDLHTHSIISHDGGITADQYTKILESGILDCIAITDHNETRFARRMYDRLGNKIIVGEEIKTRDGEIIGLFLKQTIKPGMSALETVSEIHAQRGVVYIPHPFETFRSGLKQSVLEDIQDQIDCIEVFNGRGLLRGRPKEAVTFAQKGGIAQAASSDAHFFKGLGVTYSTISEMPTNTSLPALLQKGELVKKHAPMYTLLAPLMNKIKNRIILSKSIYEQ